jgi:uncharacterized protein YerC
VFQRTSTSVRALMQPFGIGFSLMHRVERALVAIRNEQEASAVLKALCSPRELRAIKKRWRAIQLLHAGTTQREAAKLVRTSIATVTRAARAVREHDHIVTLLIGRLR